jgi:hypothetical protein
MILLFETANNLMERVENPSHGASMAVGMESRFFGALLHP